MMSNLRSTIDRKVQSISQFFIQTLLFSVLVLTAPQVFAVTMDKNFDHYNTNFPLDGAHKNKARCDSCHKRGIFKGTPQSCQTCHGTNSKIATSTMSSKHVRVSGECDTCHNQNSWSAVRMDHSAVSGTCKSCHGITKGVTGPPPNHSKKDCGDCHRSRAWKPAFGYAHSASDTNCVLCHTSSGIASRTAKNSRHIAIIGQDCGACHSNERPSFKSGVKMDHSVVSTNCKSCHDGSQTSIGAQSYTMSRKITHQTHVTDLTDCQGCHKSGYTTWNGGSNVPVPGIGSGNHNGKFTSQSCGTSGCHTSGGGAAPQSHTLGMASPAIINASCGDCHAGSTAKMKHAGNTKVGACKVCHTNSGAGRSMKGKKVSDTTIHGTTVNSPETSRCDNCHKERDRGGSFKPSSMRAHDGIKANACQNCHKGQVSNASQFSTQHATITSSNQCASCHVVNSFTRINKNDVHGLALNLNQCGRCHNSNVTYPKNMRTKKGNKHDGTITASTNCTDCHNTSRFSRLDFVGLHGNANVIGKLCTACHRSGVPYPTGGKRKGAGHEGGNGKTCDAAGCHTRSISLKRWDYNGL
jgi:hypothetical protein